MATKLKTVGDELSAMDAKPEGLALLRVPFAAHHISKLPKPYKKDSPKGNCPECGGYHGLPAMHLDYVGHAALTDRLLDTDPNWNWEPMGLNPDGTPALDRNGGLWIKLTVCGVTRPGYGCADGKSGGDAMKEIIGDALRNAAMRFGAALDLWHKGDLHVEQGDDPPVIGTDEPKPEKRVPLAGPYTSKTALWTAFKQFDRTLRGCGDLGEFEAFLQTDEVVELLEQCKRDAPNLHDSGEGLPEEFEPALALIARLRKELADAEPVA